MAAYCAQPWLVYQKRLSNDIVVRVIFPKTGARLPVFAFTASATV